MKKIPDNLKKQILGISGLIFLILTFGIGPTNSFGLEQFIQDKTDYFFGVTTYFLDYGLISLIPFFGIILNSKRTEFKHFELIIDILKILGWAILLFIIGLYFLTFIGKSSNPLIPQSLIIEPIFLYSTIIIGIGISIPFLFAKPYKKRSEINDIGIEK
ncbi:hypothetical protein ATE84_3816 [Aquimarina sp. MAR_2010_214]|uniref:hypothetical protein n=1 Tax=Aquimarina sp. MAR_2010_214 TaxID=1250026 RepID=UPI000C70D7D7|nr:hypothetical protein [Aquimarina sp. MAR_2010_214]PKV51718.1 hypothetical protein ATE84_3816 [Aquimarina sp. MAR_2010_214]